MASLDLLENKDLIFQTSGKQKISVYHTKNCDGGGKSFGQQYINVIKTRYPGRTFDSCLDWCAGPGFIGFSLFDHDICKSLHLIDYYPPAMHCATKTVHSLQNHQKNLVQIHQIDDLTLLPKSITVDLVVANPPHFSNGISTELNLLNKSYFGKLPDAQRTKLLNTFLPIDDNNVDRITVDQNWQSHKNFYSNIKSHLATDGVILMQENAAGSSPSDFESMISSAGLEITDVFFDHEYYDIFPSMKIYYIEIKHKTS